MPLAAADDAELIVVLQNAPDGVHGVGFPIEQLGLLIAGDAGGKGGEGLGDIAGARNRDGKLLFTGRAGLEKRLNVVDLPEDLFGMADKDLAVGRQEHTLGAAGEQRHAETGLQLLDGAAERRLADKEPVGRPVDGICFGDLDGVFHVKKIHA